jgi:hypothetical protein
MTTTRRLAATADIAGYSHLMGLDEAGTAWALREHRAAADPLIADHGGRIAHPAATAGFSIKEGKIPGETDCLLEGDGFEPSVSSCDRPTPSS